MTAKNRTTRNYLVFLGKELTWFFAVIIFGIILGSIAVYFFSTPSVEKINNFPFHLTSILYDRTGTVELYRLYDEENRIEVPHNEIPDSIRQATIATEDAYFYSHNGINPFSILRAMIVNIKHGEIQQGGSTITQQLARTLYLTRERTLGRKIREAFLAIKIDRHFSKDEILDLYLNAIPYGTNAYGIEAASETYFNKNAKDLTLDESAMLAALPNAPTYYSPYLNHSEGLVQRQKMILQKMYDLKYISNDQLQSALNANTLAKVAPHEQKIVAPHFVFYVLDELHKKYTDDELRTSGLRVITSLDLSLQAAAEKSVREGAARNKSRRASNAALVALDAKDGEVLAMVGSKDYYDQSVDGYVNVTLQARQPGSAFKPFAYAKAFEEGFQPETPIWDRPVNFGPDGSGKNYIPHNYDGRFHGLLTMRQALSMSLNVPAVQTLALAGVQNVIELAERLGITTLTDHTRYGLALVLGGAEVRPLDMAHAFSVFSQEGMAHDISPFVKITDRTGKEYIWNSEITEKRVLDPEVARKINSILSDNKSRTPTFGPHSPLAFPPGIQVAAKTGTTQNFRDAWTVGYTPSIAVAVWAGNNDNRPMAQGADGIFVAAPIWRDFMNTALNRFPETGFTAYTPQQTTFALASLGPSGDSKTIYVDKRSGKQISPEKAKKTKKKHVDSFKIGDVHNSDGKSKSGLITMDQIRAFYRNP